MPATLDPTETKSSGRSCWDAWTCDTASSTTASASAPAPPRSDAPASSGSTAAARAKNVAYERPSQGRTINEKGHLAEVEVDANDRLMVIGMHLWPAVAVVAGPFGFALPFILWIAGRRRSAFVDDHGRAVLDSLISYTIWTVVLAITFIGIAAWPVLAIVYLVGSVRGVMAASRNEYHRYPMCLDFTAKPNAVSNDGGPSSGSATA